MSGRLKRSQRSPHGSATQRTGSIMQQMSVDKPCFRHDVSPKPMATAGVRTLHPMLVPFPVAYFAAALVTDLAYWRTAEVMWERFSVWLIAGGLVMAALVAVAAIIDLAFRKQMTDWPRALGFALAV